MVEIAHHSCVAASAARGAVFKYNVRKLLVQPLKHGIYCLRLPHGGAFSARLPFANGKQLIACNVVINTEEIQAIFSDNPLDFVFNPRCSLWYGKINKAAGLRSVICLIHLNTMVCSLTPVQSPVKRKDNSMRRSERRSRIF